MTANQASTDLTLPPVDLILRCEAQRSLEGRGRAPMPPATPPWFEALLRKTPHHEGCCSTPTIPSPEAP
jgi:hypothetical protein